MVPGDHDIKPLLQGKPFSPPFQLEHVKMIFLQVKTTVNEWYGITQGNALMILRCMHSVREPPPHFRLGCVGNLN